MPLSQTATIAPPSARVTTKRPATTNMKNEWLALARPRPNFSIPFRDEEVATGATVLMLDIYHSRTSLAPIEELIERFAATRRLGRTEVPLVYEIVKDSGSSVYVIVEVIGPTDLILGIAEGLVGLGLGSLSN